MIDARVKQLDTATLKLIDQICKGGAEVPHLTELYQRIMEAFDGAGGFAQHFMAQYLMAKPGSSIRTKLLMATIAMGKEVSAMGGAQLPVEAMQDEELVYAATKIVSGQSREILRIQDGNGQAEKAS